MIFSSFRFFIPLIALIGFNFLILSAASKVNVVIKIILISNTIIFDNKSTFAFHIKPDCISIALANIGNIKYDVIIPRIVNNKPLIIYGIMQDIIISLLVYPSAFNAPILDISSSIVCSILNLLTNKHIISMAVENTTSIKTIIFEMASLPFLDCSL